MTKIVCEGCGAVYEIEEHHIIMRDKDSIECHHCNTTLISWNGGHWYTDKEISGPTKNFIKKENL
ncbi:MAG: hypothetical protein KBA61_00075 [Spirochaetes bacterium]|nr:hypothetical protein [Spirochaetota bacterium]